MHPVLPLFEEEKKFSITAWRNQETKLISLPDTSSFEGLPKTSSGAMTGILENQNKLQPWTIFNLLLL